MTDDGSNSRAPSSSDKAATNSETASTSLRSSEITPEQEYFLYELETSDSGSIGLVLRAIYDGGDADKFMGVLERKIRHYDRDIERLCNFHYQGFIEAIKHLLEVKEQCSQLKDEVSLIDEHLKESSQPLLKKAEEIVRYRKMQQNIASAIDAVSHCLPMLEKYSKLQEQMDQKRYYPALKTLEQLEHTYFPRFENYRFAKLLIDQVGSIRNEIKDASFTEFKDFLEQLRKVSSRVGQAALKHVAQRHSIDASMIDSAVSKQGKDLPPTLLNATREQGGGVSAETTNGTASATDEDEFIAQDIVDYQPVYRCCHIFSVLGAKDDFESYYQKQRREQASLVLKSPDRMHQALDAYLRYFFEVVGFFVIEDTVMKTAPGLVTRNYREELWELALQHVVKTLNTHFGNCTDAEIMLRIKNLILLFSLSMKDYGFQVSPFYQLLQNFRHQYNEILMRECLTNFEDILQRDNYTPITVGNPQEYRQVIDKYPVYNKTLEQESFPKKFPFSAFVPNTYDQVKQYIKGSFRFTEKLGLNQTDVEDTIRRDTNGVLDRLSGQLKAYISQSERKLTLVQLVQITINMGYLEKSCESLEQYITKLIGISESSAHAVQLKQGAHMFTDARGEVEHQIYEALNQKISLFLDLATYDWEVNESQGRASGYIMDLIAFLNSTFSSFTNLPVTLARAACMSACKYLAMRLLQFLTDPEVKGLSMGALEQFNLDLIQCEQFAAQCPVPGFEDGTLLLTFAELRQILDLFMSWDWSAYLADLGQERNKYVRVSPGVAITLLQKILEWDKRKSSLFTKTASSKDKRKLLETVLRQLKSQ